MASVDPTIAPSVASVSNAKEALDHLHTTFANKSQTRIYSLRDLLAKVSKDNKSVVEYLREIRSLADELVVAGSTVTHEELVIKILNGLRPEYSQFSVAIRTRDTPISYEELFEKLSDHEIFLQHEEQKKKQTNSITAQIAQQNISSNNIKSNRPYICRSKSHNDFEAKALFASTSNSSQAPWILDTGASHYIIDIPQNLATAQDYTGPAEISMGNGNAIPITHT
uniref:Uncharacterized protein n=1 Tax=Nicotiana tabacum TaxID=4097 RepID=A0A1S4AU81_TOBAC|nr:PREDICTED: uncharacterized protein LOC107801431 [Nicotiana tabacum]